ncbi:hypothetical protein M426DRAFT_150731 [Hypoxylon sp. CI-4A]|nr:hypothetical protein M426DRAFT_150731 [Hypoxylon sp. CI-4A]
MWLDWAASISRDTVLELRWFRRKIAFHFSPAHNHPSGQITTASALLFSMLMLHDIPSRTIFRSTNKNFPTFCSIYHVLGSRTRTSWGPHPAHG